ncbi:MAG: radical SAM protein [Wenzhouxiangellaceae bacterium]|nr:radical SAM protein [Wenzhouxiangellaceae bacterium]
MRRRLRRGRHDTSRSLNTARNLEGRFCANPFGQLDVYSSGNLHMCCNAWLTRPIGNLNRQSVEQAWNSTAARQIRESIFDGSFRYCDHKVCPFIQNDSLPTLAEAALDPRFTEAIEQRQTRLDYLPTFVNFCNDESCNLFCPSCRTERINYNEGPAFEKRSRLHDKLVQALFEQPTDRRFRISVTGSGDPFASRVFREFLYNLDGRHLPNLEISLQTNGVLLTPRTWQRMHRIRERITDIIVSFDASRPQTYAVTRRGGHWPTLLENTRELGRLRSTGELRFLKLDFVVQQANYREMPEFVELGKQLGADEVGFSLLMNWGTWTPAEFNVRCIWRPDHPEFGSFLEVLRDPRLADPSVDLGNASEYRNRAMAQATPD